MWKWKIIYDSRHHGYNAIVVDKCFFSMDKEYQYSLIQKKSMEVEIKLRYDLTYKEYCEEAGEKFSKEFSNAFSNIEIYGIINGKKKKFFEEETA